jgi:hypothetical protein
MSHFRKFVIFIHRYLGIPMSVVFVVWFVSGVVMMYAGGMPSISPDMRISRLTPLALEEVRFSPAEAADAAGILFVGSVSLQSVLGRPAFRFGGFRGATTVFADTGEVLDEAGVEETRQAAADFIGQPVGALAFAGTVNEIDQWTLTQSRELPLHRFEVEDGRGTLVYASPRTGEVTLVTDRRSRALAWAGTIPHWFYFTRLRVNQPLWYWTVVWVSALGCVLAVLGLVLGVTQFRRSKPFSLMASIRYRGWMRWHYLSGALFGIFALTWVFSGLLSMEPFAWTNATGLEIDREVLTGGPVEPEAYPRFDSDRWAHLLDGRAPKEIELLRIDGDPYFLVRSSSDERYRNRERLHQPYTLDLSSIQKPLLVDARTLEPRRKPFATDKLVRRLASATDVEVASQTLLSEYDSYYYARDGAAPLPVLKVTFADPDTTSYYIDPAMGRVVARTHRYARLERWLFNGLHSLDFSFWYASRPLWDIGMILLSIGALATSLIGLCLGFRRLAR